MSQGEEVPIEEACAMTTRVSPSFIRIGHFDLFGRLLDTPVDDVRFYSCITAFFYIGCPQICLFTAFFHFHSTGARVTPERPRPRPVRWRSSASCKPSESIRARAAALHRKHPPFLSIYLFYMAEHALFREYSEWNDAQTPLQQVEGASAAHFLGVVFLCSCVPGLSDGMYQRVLHMAEQFKNRLAGMIAGWIRVGFCQGNFNADNCLVGGRTMDYGPFGACCCRRRCWCSEDGGDEATQCIFLHFYSSPATSCATGFVDAFDPEWCSWTGGAPHFSFMNQMDAGFANFAVFTRNLVPLLDEQGAQQLKAITAAFPIAAKLQLHQAMAAKLGVAHTHPAFDTLLQQCEPSRVCPLECSLTRCAQMLWLDERQGGGLDVVLEAACGAALEDW